MNRVDVVVPCYNYGRFLHQSVGSVLSQEGVDVRVLVIDDCSPDDTPQVGKHLAAIDPRVEYRRHEVNRGHIASYNEGLLEWASAEYSLLLSADDMLAPGALARATDLMERHPDIGMTYGMTQVIIGEQVPTFSTASASTEYRIVAGSRFLQECFENAYCLVATPSAVVRTAVQQEVGGYCAHLPHSGDVEMWMRFGFHGSIGVLRAVQAYYRWHGSNMSSTYYDQCIGDQLEFWQACKYALERWGARHPQSRLWWNSISQRLGEEGFWSASRALDRGETRQCRAWLEFAEKVHPDIRFSGMWWRLWAKRFLGHTLWRKLQPVLDKVRGIREASSTPLETVLFRSGDEVGWWPE